MKYLKTTVAAVALTLATFGCAGSGSSPGGPTPQKAIGTTPPHANGGIEKPSPNEKSQVLCDRQLFVTLQAGPQTANIKSVDVRFYLDQSGTSPKLIVRPAQNVTEGHTLYFEQTDEGIIFCEKDPASESSGCLKSNFRYEFIDGDLMNATPYYSIQGYAGHGVLPDGDKQLTPGAAAIGLPAMDESVVLKLFRQKDGSLDFSVNLKRPSPYDSDKMTTVVWKESLTEELRKFYASGTCTDGTLVLP